MSATNPSDGAMAAASSICDSGMDTNETRLIAARIIDQNTNLIADDLAKSLEEMLEFSVTPPAISKSARSVLGRYKWIKK